MTFCDGLNTMISDPIMWMALVAADVGGCLLLEHPWQGKVLDK